MATNSMAISHGAEARSFSQGAVVVLGRFFYVLLFLMAGPSHFSRQEVAMRLPKGCPWPRSWFRSPGCWPSLAA